MKVNIKMKSNENKKIKLNPKIKEEANVGTFINNRKYPNISDGLEYNEINLRNVYLKRKNNNNYIFNIYRYIIINILISSVLIRDLKAKIDLQNNFIK